MGSENCKKCADKNKQIEYLVLIILFLTACYVFGGYGAFVGLGVIALLTQVTGFLNPFLERFLQERKNKNG